MFIIDELLLLIGDVMEFVEVMIYLFGKPEWEFGGEINPKIIKAKGDELKERLYGIADNLQKLLDNGWDCVPTLYDLSLTKNISKATAEKELKKLGINEELIVLNDGE